MKNNHGFTLIEVLGVIIILSCITAIVYPEIKSIIVKNSEKIYNEQIERYKSVADTYISDNNETLTIGSNLCISLDDLYNGGYIKSKDLKDPRDNSVMKGAINATWDEVHNRYSYTYEKDLVCPTS